ncbi:prepilin-type N-terminal cleavage/methylation domain-containing protein [Blautia faecis]|uniref:type IV pilin protein n=1 Tax=Blautia faecis TaxID=871665 RepID=UPI0028A535C2|nr:prepilin-type N-terminal cleavage/methylation domain-containing protein [Blautia faecis]MDT4371479.1 prepilin-type N-terminal cleavage/methylation domain-containing protein [Blautia faecis]
MAKFYKCAQKHSNRKTRGKGFTLAELLIVVAIIAVLVAISIPIFTSQLHKARVATDWANLRAYYAEIQADFISTGEYNKKVPYEGNPNSTEYFPKEITFLNGQKVKMQEGFFWVRPIAGKGYTIAYDCNNRHPKCELILE